MSNMIARNLKGVEFMVCNTDAQHLSTTLTDNRLQLGKSITEGLGCGANPDAGRKVFAAVLEGDQEFFGVGRKWAGERAHILLACFSHHVSVGAEDEMHLDKTWIWCLGRRGWRRRRTGASFSRESVIFWWASLRGPERRPKDDQGADWGGGGGFASMQ